VIHATRKEALERGRVDPGLAELPGSFRCKSEALDRITALYCALADDFQRRSFPGSREPLQAVNAVAGV
jgi:hypothetical protein